MTIEIILARLLNLHHRTERITSSLEAFCISDTEIKASDSGCLLENKLKWTYLELIPGCFSRDLRIRDSVNWIRRANSFSFRKRLKRSSPLAFHGKVPETSNWLTLRQLKNRHLNGLWINLIQIVLINDTDSNLKWIVPILRNKPSSSGSLTYLINSRPSGKIPFIVEIYKKQSRFPFIRFLK